MEHWGSCFKYNKNSMEKVLACRRDRHLYFSALRQKHHHRQANHTKTIYEHKIMNLLNLEANIATIIDLTTKLQLLINRKNREAFTKIQNASMPQRTNDLGQKQNLKYPSWYPRNRIKLALNYMRLSIGKNEKNKKLEGWAAIRTGKQNEHRIHKFVMNMEKTVRMRVRPYFGQLKARIYEESLDFFDISAIEPKGTHKGSFQITNEELNTEESSLGVISKRQKWTNEVQELENIESDLENLRKKLHKKQKKNKELDKALEDQNCSHSKAIQQLKNKIYSIKQQQKGEQKMKSKNNEGKMVVLGKYMGLCLELQQKISLSVEILQQIFQSQRHWDIHPQLDKFLRPYLQKIKQQNNIGQNCDIL